MACQNAKQKKSSHKRIEKKRFIYFIKARTKEKESAAYQEIPKNSTQGTGTDMKPVRINQKNLPNKRKQNTSVRYQEELNPKRKQTQAFIRNHKNRKQNSTETFAFKYEHEVWDQRFKNKLFGKS